MKARAGRPLRRVAVPPGSLPALLLFLLGVGGCTLAGPGPAGTPAPPDLPPPSMDRPPPDTTVPPDRADPVDPVDPAHPPVTRDPAAIPGDPSDGLLPPVRALWVVRTALVHPDSARAAVARADAAGFNTLLVQVRGRGDAWYASSREPGPEPLLGGDPAYDPLRVVLDEAHARGLRVHAWINVHLVAGALRAPIDPLHLARRNPEHLAVPRELATRLFTMDPGSPAILQALLTHARANGDRVEGIYTSPVQPEVREHLRAVVAELVDGYELHGLHLDYLRFPSRAYDYGRRTLEAFRAHVRAGPSAGRPAGRLAGAEEARLADAEEAWLAENPFAYTDAFAGEWDAFREQGVARTLEVIAHEVRRRRPQMLVTAAVFPDPVEARIHRFQPWDRWLADGLLDVAAPMAYTRDDPDFEAVIRRAGRVAGPGRIWVGVGAYTNSLEGAVRKARLVSEAGLAGLVLFSYDWAVGPEGRAAAGGDYLASFARAAFTPRTGIPPSSR